jgi:hypothetical protein
MIKKYTLMKQKYRSQLSKPWMLYPQKKPWMLEHRPNDAEIKEHQL